MRKFIIILLVFNSVFANAQRKIPAGGTAGQRLTIKPDGINLYWANVTAGSAAWGSITGTLSSQTDLVTALNLRLLKTDTATMLSPYFRKSDSLKWHNQILNLSNIKLNKSDTIHLTFTSPLIRQGNAISMTVASGSANGYLSSTDWTTFNNKQAAVSAGRGLTLNSNVFRLDTSLTYTWIGQKFTGNITFPTDNTYDIGASGATRPRTGYFGTSLNIGSVTGSFPLNVIGTGTTTASMAAKFVGGTGSGSGGVYLGSYSSGYGGVWSAGITPATDNYMIVSNGGNTILNTTSGGSIAVNGTQTPIQWNSQTVTIGNGTTAGNPKLTIPIAPTASSAYGLVSRGSGAFDGSTSGFYAGNANGQVDAINLASGSTSDFANWQLAGSARFKFDNAGAVTAVKYQVSAMNTAPSSASDTGTLGEIRVTATYIYVCTATNTWVRTALATW